MDDQKQNPNSPSAWLALPEIGFPNLKSATQKGAIYSVYNVGFLLASKKDCDAAGVQADLGPMGKCVLPTAVVEFSDEQRLCRLPLALAPWVYGNLQLVDLGALGFPATVEFGILNGRPYGEFVD